MRIRGFTLIELLVVIAIIGILAALVVTRLGNAQAKGRNSQAQNDITQFSKAAELYKVDPMGTAEYIDSGTDTSTSAQTGYPSGVYIGPVATLIGTAVNESSTAGSLLEIFGGTSNVFTANNARYATKMNQTQDGYTYAYKTQSKGGTSSNRQATNSTNRNANSTCYLLWTTLNASVGGHSYFVINTGASSLTNTAPSICLP